MIKGVKGILILIFLPIALTGFVISLRVVDIPRNLYPQITITLLILIAVNGIAAYVVIFAYLKNLQYVIKQIINTNNEISKGNFSVSLDIFADSQFSELSESYNFMAKTLAISKEIADDRTDRIKAILESLADAVIAVDNIGRIVMMNRAAEKLFEIPREVAGQHLIQAVRNYELYGFIYGCMNTGNPGETEIKLKTKERLVRVHATPYKSREGKTLGIVVIVRDITELRKLEKMRTDFVANVSHELRTPLTSIKGFVETLLDGAYKDPKITERFLKIIDDEAGRLNRIISELLDLAQLEANKVKLNIQDVDLKEMVDEVYLVFEKRLQEKNVSFTWDIPNLLPKVAADPDWLRQVFINLIDNAIKYTLPGGSIAVRAEKIDQFVKVQVEDTGVGIPEEALPRIFERFYRVDKARSRQEGGTGLGLSIVKHVVKILGGEISVQSKPGLGTTFVLTLKIQNK